MLMQSILRLGQRCGMLLRLGLTGTLSEKRLRHPWMNGALLSANKADRLVLGLLLIS